jgi:uncharacterized membrane protein
MLPPSFVPVYTACIPGIQSITYPHLRIPVYRSLRDISGSAFQLLMAQGWLSVWTPIITIISVFFFNYIQDGRTQPIDWSVASFMVGVFPLPKLGLMGMVVGQLLRLSECHLMLRLQVFLPLLSTVWWAFQRREQALRDLAESEAMISCPSM